MENYFKVTEETKVNIFGITLFRLELTKKCKWGNVGDKGGWIESEFLPNGNARVSGNAWVSGNAEVYGNAWVYGDAQVYGDARVSGNAEVYGDADICWFSKFGSQNRTTTFFKTKEKSIIKVNCGCFQGTLKQFSEKVIFTHKENEFAKQYLAMIELVKIKFGLCDI